MRCKRVLTVLLSVLAVSSLAGCKEELTDAQKMNKSAKEYSELVYEKYTVKFDGDDYMLEYYPTKSGEVSKAYLWSYFGGLGMQYRLIKNNPDDAGAKANYKQMLNALKYYRSPSSSDTVVKYHSGRGAYPNYGSGDVFFDDNIWVARNLLYAYEIFGEDFYLQEAKKVTNFIYTGWNKELNGLVWNERGLTEQGTAQELERGLSANACGIIVNTMLYQITKEQSYMDWALAFYDFCKTMQDPETFIYYNGIHTIIENGVRKNGSVNKALYSYNPGSMMIANVLLYETTKDEKYLNDAKVSTKAAHDYFVMPNLANNVQFYNDFVWFTAIMMEGFLDVSKYMDVSEYVNVFKESIDYGVKNLKNKEGFIPYSYTSGFNDKTVDDRSLLTQSGLAEIMCLLASYYATIK